MASTLTPCRWSRSTWAWMSLRRHREIVEAARPVDSAGDELRVAGEQAQDVDVLEEADVSAVGPDRETPLVVPRHQEQRLEDEVVRLDRD